jgi:glycosyltransferase involved in cell wall biosynthesis
MTKEAGMKSSQRRMRILMSAYACRPGVGAESNLGWQWATGLARAGHHVQLLTHVSNQDLIESRLINHPEPGLEINYTGLPWSGSGTRLDYVSWQLAAFAAARRLCQETRFDVVHHLTFGQFHDPCLMAFLGLPFVFGPVGGGEAVPSELRPGRPARGYAREALRDLTNGMVELDPLMSAIYERAAVILCKTGKTMLSIPERFRGKCQVQLDIGADAPDSMPARRPRGDRRFRVLFVGRLEHGKGLHLGLQSFAALRRRHPEALLTVMGGGPDEAALHALAQRLDLSAAVNWMPWSGHDTVLHAYGQHDVLLATGLQDASGEAVLEAMSRGLPVIALDSGGAAATLIDSSCGFRIRPRGPEAVVEGLASALSSLAEDPELSRRMSEAAWRRARREFSWTARIMRMERLYRRVCESEGPDSNHPAAQEPSAHA